MPNLAKEALMASASAQIERRRASRLLIRIPVSLVSNDNGGQRIYASAEAVTISRFGALLRTPIEPDSGSVLEILNSLNEEVKEFRVIWAVTGAAERPLRSWSGNVSPGRQLLGRTVS